MSLAVCWRITDGEMAMSIVCAILGDGEDVASEFYQNLGSLGDLPEGSIIETMIQLDKYVFPIRIPVSSLQLIDITGDFNQVLHELTICLMGHTLSAPIF